MFERVLGQCPVHRRSHIHRWSSDKQVLPQAKDYSNGCPTIMSFCIIFMFLMRLGPTVVNAEIVENIFDLIGHFKNFNGSCFPDVIHQDLDKINNWYANWSPCAEDIGSNGSIVNFRDISIDSICRNRYFRTGKWVLLLLYRNRFPM